MRLELERTPNVVRRVYEGFFAAGAPFAGVFAWGCPADLTLDSIIDWNQERLDRGFRLRSNQHVAHNYRQILLDLPPFSRARLILRPERAGVAFQLIVPESELDEASQARLEQLAAALWEGLQPRSIQTYGELGAAHTHEALADGKPLSAELFAWPKGPYPRGD